MPMTRKRPWTGPKLAGIQAREEAARLYVQHAGELMRYARTVAADESLAAEAVQEAFLRYLALRRGGQAILNPRGWLLRVLRNYVLDAKRRGGQMEAAEFDHAAGAVDSSQDPYESFRQRELANALASCLTPREKDCLELRLTGMRQTEIASALGLRTGTVGALLSRAGKKVRAVFQMRGACPAA